MADWIEEGVYTIWLAADTRMCLAVENDSDAVGQDVRLVRGGWPEPNDGSLWRVVPRWDAKDEVALVNVMTGKALALPHRDGVIADAQKLWEERLKADKEAWDRQQKEAKEAWDEAEEAKKQADSSYNKQSYDTVPYPEPAEPDWWGADSVTFPNASGEMPNETRLLKYATGWALSQWEFNTHQETFRFDTQKVDGDGAWFGGVWYDKWVFHTDVEWPTSAGGAVTASEIYFNTEEDVDRGAGVYVHDWADIRDNWGIGYCGFILVPFAYTVPEGTYQIVCPSGNLLGLRKDTKANWEVICQVADTGEGDPPARTVWQVKHDEDNEGVCFLRNMYSGSWMATQNDPATEGDSLVQWDNNETDSERFVLAAMRASKEINGVVSDGYHIRAVSGSNLVVSTGRIRNGWFSTLQSVNQGYDHDLWLRPVDVVSDDVPTPSDIRFSTELGGVPTSTIMAGEDGWATAYLSFSYSGPRAKSRWRWIENRGTAATQSGPESVVGGEWMAMDGSPANSGLGPAWGEGYEVRNIGGRSWCPYPIQVQLNGETGAFKAAVIEAAVRCVDDNHLDSGITATGREVSGTLRIVPQVKASVTAATWSPDGLRLGYELSGADGEEFYVRVETLAASGDDVLVSPVELRDAGASGYVTVPIRYLKHRVRNGSIVSGTVTAGSGFSGESTSEFSVACRYSANNGRDATPQLTANVANRWVQAYLGEHEEAAFWTLCETDDGPRYLRADKVGIGYHLSYPTLGEMCEGYAMVRDGDQWGVWFGILPVLPEVKPHPALFNWPGGWFQLTYDVVDTGTYSRQFRTTGAEGDGFDRTVFFGPASEERTVSGTIFTDEAPGASFGSDSAKQFRELIKAGHVTYRDPYGNVCRCAVTDGTDPHEFRTHGTVTVSIRKEDGL